MRKTIFDDVTVFPSLQRPPLNHGPDPSTRLKGFTHYCRGCYVTSNCSLILVWVMFGLFRISVWGVRKSCRLTVFFLELFRMSISGCRKMCELEVLFHSILGLFLASVSSGWPKTWKLKSILLNIWFGSVLMLSVCHTYFFLS